jgi:phospholipase C
MFLEHFVQKKYGKTVRAENISAWLRSICDNLTSVFRPYNASDPALDFLDRDKFVVSIQKSRYKAIPSNDRKLTAGHIEEVNQGLLHSQFAAHQEPGIRPACALPYELYADGSLSADCTSFEPVKVIGSEADARFAGRVETGRPGFSDSLMGGVV